MASFKPSWLLYGATGFSGRLIAQAAKARGHNVIFAGRDAAKVEALAAKLGGAHRV
ncbi:MAG: SDR family oxidoreductase, partial [Rhodanobacteraceae bacterium]|nr:SDR family oxidoreductase [Rhodanobacteraceae bacterium]